MGDTYDQDKRLIRDRLRASRSRLSPGEVARLSAEACARLLGSPVFARACHIAAYAAADNELDPALLVEAALAAGKNVYLPVKSRERFDFVGLPVARPGQEAGGAPEPPGGPCLPPEADGVVFLVPGVAFDAPRPLPDGLAGPRERRGEVAGGQDTLAVSARRGRDGGKVDAIAKAREELTVPDGEPPGVLVHRRLLGSRPATVVVDDGHKRRVVPAADPQGRRRRPEEE